jgi:hypothetical protein
MAVIAADLKTGIIGWQGAAPSSVSTPSPLLGIARLGALIGGGLAVAAFAGNFAFIFIQTAATPAAPPKAQSVQSTFTSTARADYASSPSAPIAPQRVIAR